ncbi:MAG: hypothetical protein ACJA00_005505 [Myxococcota bacterium]|jgi:hypothetical protein
MNDEGTTIEVADDVAPDLVSEVPLIFTLSLAIPVFAVLVFVFMRLFGGRAGPSQP